MGIVVLGYVVCFSRFGKKKTKCGMSHRHDTADNSCKTDKPDTPPSTAHHSQIKIDNTMTAIGYIDGQHGDKPFVIPEKDRQNIGIFGEIGSGKTTVLRLLIMQDIMRKTGFLLIDPHREFSREVLSMIPQDMKDKVVYISLASLYQFGRTVCINPLQTDTDHEKYIRTAGCIDNLKQYFSDGWGHRLETVLRNMINLVMSTPDTFKFLDIIGVLFDENKRNQSLQRCTNPAVRDFWINVFPKFAPEAAGAIYNKFDKIINTPPIAAIFSSTESTISIKEIIEDGKIVVVDLGSAATVDIIEFVGTLLINMFNLENKIRFDLGDVAKVPFNIYIDEVHMFSAPVIRELLNNVRKYNMKVTVATQSIKVLDDNFAKELDDLFRCMVMFRCDFETGRLLARNLPLDERELAQLSFHRFAAFSQGFERVAGVGKTRHVDIPSRWKDMAQHSLSLYGKEMIPLSSSQGSFGVEKSSIMPKLSPLEYFIVNTLYLLGGSSIKHADIVSAATARFAVDERIVNSALLDSLFQHHRFVSREIDYHGGKRQFDTDASFKITKLGIQSIYSRAFAGPGAGGQLHTGVISAIADAQIAQYHYCIPDLADIGGRRADLIIYEFKPALLKKSSQSRNRMNPLLWSEDIIAVEVETDPTKHKDQVIINYEKNAQMKMQVWFVVFSQRHKDYIDKLMEEKRITQYQTIVVDPKSIDIRNKTSSRGGDDDGGSDDGDNDNDNSNDTNNDDDDNDNNYNILTDDTPDILDSILYTKYLRAPQIFTTLASMSKPDNTTNNNNNNNSNNSSDIKQDVQTRLDITSDPTITTPDVISQPNTKPRPTNEELDMYSKINNTTLEAYLNDVNFQDSDIVYDVLQKRGYGVRRKKNSMDLMIYKLPTRDD